VAGSWWRAASSGAATHPPKSPWVTGRLIAKLSRLWALHKKGKKETGWAVRGKEKVPAIGPLQGRKGDSARGALGKIEFLFLFSNLFTIRKPI
jgi:hypothetical protein